VTAGWKAKATLEGADRLVAFLKRTQTHGQAIAYLQRRTAAQAEGLRRVNESARRLAALQRLGGR
jgi:hypothetical protein